MSLDEAIQHCEEIANSKCDKCGEEHLQLANWLKELKERSDKTVYEFIDICYNI